MVRLILLGGTGAGKGTQGQRLSQHLQIPMIATGDLLREGIKNQTELGNQAQPYLEQGNLIPDPILIQFMKERLSHPDIAQGWILEGYPRTAFQAEELDFLLEDLNQRFNWAIYLKISEAVMRERSLQRGLKDDTATAIEQRIAQYHQYTIPLLEYYEKKHHLLTVNGEQSIEAVEAEIMEKIKPLI